MKKQNLFRNKKIIYILMRYVKFFEELNIQTYLNDNINIPAFNPKGKEIAKLDKDEFFKKYPKSETIIEFKDKEATYELYFKDIKSDCLIFKTESGKEVKVTKPYHIEDTDLEKISLLPIRIEDNSLNLINEMFAAMPI
jgi:hypothetical protein